MNLLKINQVEVKYGVSRSRIYDRISKGIFPPPLKNGGTSVWAVGEVDVMVNAIIGGCDNEQMQKIVVKLIENRAAARAEALQFMQPLMAV